MDALEKLDLLEEHADLVTKLQGGNVDPLDKLDMLERLAEIIELLGGDVGTDIEATPSQNDDTVSLTGNEFGYTDDMPIEELREKAIGYLADMRDDWFDVPALSQVEKETKVQLRQRGIDHMESFSPNPEKLLLLSKIKQLLKVAKYLYTEKNTKKSQKPTVDKYHFLYNTFQWADKPHNYVLVIEKDDKGMLHYDILLGKYAARHLEKAKQMIFEQKKMTDALHHDKNPWNTSVIDDDYNNVVLDSQSMFDKAAIDADDMVINLFIFDENGNEITDDDLIGEPQPTALQTILSNLQSGEITPTDLDFNHLAELAQDGDNNTLSQIRAITDTALANEWQGKLDAISDSEGV